jgi:hypothetical protein
MKTKVTERPCIDCKVVMEYIPRRVRCVECYKKNLQKDCKFIKDDDYGDETTGASLK